MSVTVTVTAGSAVQGVDFKAVKTRTLTFKPGQREKLVTIPVYADEVVDGNQDVIVTLSNALGGATISRAVGVVTVIDDD